MKVGENIYMIVIIEFTRMFCDNQLNWVWEGGDNEIFSRLTRINDRKWRLKSFIFYQQLFLKLKRKRLTRKIWFLFKSWRVNDISAQVIQLWKVSYWSDWTAEQIKKLWSQQKSFKMLVLHKELNWSPLRKLWSSQILDINPDKI